MPTSFLGVDAARQSTATGALVAPQMPVVMNWFEELKARVPNPSTSLCAIHGHSRVAPNSFTGSARKHDGAKGHKGILSEKMFVRLRAPPGFVACRLQWYECMLWPSEEQ
jgi:hypothetical protein